MRSLRSLWRMALLAAHFARGWFALRFTFAAVPQVDQRRRTKQWCDRLLRIAGVSVEVRGSPSGGGPSQFVANHVSWLDVIVIQSLLPCRFVAKREIRAWPVIGDMASRCGTLFIDRNSRAATLNAADAISGALVNGEHVILFPEGTTTDGSEILPFRASLLQGAINAQAPAIPVSLLYAHEDAAPGTAGASYSGEDTLLGSMWRTLATDVHATVSFGGPVQTAGRHRRALAAELHSDVVRMTEAAASMTRGCPVHRS